MQRTTAILLLGLSTLFLVGGGVAGTAPNSTNFSWSSTTRGTPSTIDGIGESVTFSGNTSKRNLSLNNPTVGEASLTVTYTDTTSGSPMATSATIQSAGLTTAAPYNSSISRPDRNFSIDNFQPTTRKGVNANVVNPFTAGWDYQTFSNWYQFTSTPTGGTISVGLETTEASIPTAGTATYSGLVHGVAIQNGTSDGDGSIPGNNGLVLSDMIVNVDFASRSIDFKTTNSRILSASGNDTQNSTYDLSGTLEYDPDTHTITGTVSSAGGLDGNVDGRFYGPSAQEIGGTFFLGSGTTVFAGGFGGKQ